MKVGDLVEGRFAEETSLGIVLNSCADYVYIRWLDMDREIRYCRKGPVVTTGSMRVISESR